MKLPSLEDEGERRIVDRRLRLLTTVSLLSMIVPFLVSSFTVHTTFVIASSSMTPTLMPGDIVTTSLTNGEIANGTIIVFKSSFGGYEAHRVVGESLFGKDVYYSTKGDANNRTDSFLVSGAYIVGPVSRVIPKLGLFFMVPREIVLLATISLVFLYVFLTFKTRDESDKRESTDQLKEDQELRRKKRIFQTCCVISILVLTNCVTSFASIKLIYCTSPNTVSLTSPKVVLQNGNTGSSTIYDNGINADVTVAASNTETLSPNAAGDEANLSPFPTVYEYYNTGDDGAGSVHGATWRAQTFKPSTAHTITRVKLYMYKSGSPGTLTVSIRATSGGLPTGADLCSGTIDGNTLVGMEWREITLGAGKALVAGTTYAIVVRATGGNSANLVALRKDSVGDYAGGYASVSTNSGGAWTGYSAQDILFEERGAAEINWDKVDEATPDNDATYVYTGSATYLRDLYNIQNHGVGSGAINFITVYAQCRATATPDQASLKIAIKTGGTAFESSEVTVNTSYADYSYRWSTNPQTGGAWTWAQIDALQVGVALRRAQSASGTVYSRCTQVYVKVNSGTYDYVLRISNTVTDPWRIRLRMYSDSNVNRLGNCTIYLHNGGTSRQIYINGGSYVQQVGGWYDLAASGTDYIAISVSASSSGTSIIYAYLEVIIALWINL